MLTDCTTGPKLNIRIIAEKGGFVKRHSRIFPGRARSQYVTKIVCHPRLKPARSRHCPKKFYTLSVVIQSFQHKDRPKTRSVFGAGDEARTRYLHLGKVALYQMSYTRIRNMTYYSGFSEIVKSFFPVPKKISFRSISRPGCSGRSRRPEPGGPPERSQMPSHPAPSPVLSVPPAAVSSQQSKPPSCPDGCRSPGLSRR